MFNCTGDAEKGHSLRCTVRELPPPSDIVVAVCCIEIGRAVFGRLGLEANLAHIHFTITELRTLVQKSRAAPSGRVFRDI